jgi:hypothetical protein
MTGGAVDRRFAMTMTRSLALATVLLGGLLGSPADAATRRGGWYQWWLRQSAARAGAAADPEPNAPPAPRVPAPAPAPLPPPPAPVRPQPIVPAVMPTPAPAPAPRPTGPVTTGSLFGVRTPAAVAPPPPIAYEPAPSIPASTLPSFDYDAFLNFGDGQFAGASLLTTGGARPWYVSPTVQNLFGGVPDAATRDAFTDAVLDKVEMTYARHGLDLALTTDPKDAAAHSMSVVSGTSYGPNPDAIGITDMGNDGFTFIDKLTYATSADQLEWAVANNIAHELMHAFNVEHHSTDGNYLDAGVANWDMLVSPDAPFSPEAVADLAASDFRERFAPSGAYGAQHVHDGRCCAAGQAIAASPVPEPTTIVLWTLLGVCGVAARRRRATA